MKAHVPGGVPLLLPTTTIFPCSHLGWPSFISLFILVAHDLESISLLLLPTRSGGFIVRVLTFAHDASYPTLREALPVSMYLIGCSNMLITALSRDYIALLVGALLIIFEIPIRIITLCLPDRASPKASSWHLISDIYDF